MTTQPSVEASPPRLSVAIMTCNEEANISRALSSVAWADEVVVLDSGSEDRTCEIARAAGARVRQEPWRGFGGQRARSLELCSGIWVLALDADEAVSPKLAESIRAVIQSGSTTETGFEVVRHSFHLGTWFGGRGWHRDRVLRLVRRDRVVPVERIVHERLEVSGSVGRLEGTLLHWPYRDLAHHMEKMAAYSDLKARQMHASGRRANQATAVARSAWRFVTGYLLQGGFLYGWSGLAADLLGAHGTLLAYLKLAELGDEGERRESPSSAARP
ncbi:MAG: glycosyltransferase family 2 protein [marine benthic group bacterium]|nr:glycosyltransferase family 2 protein [Gemmatimonadota bacterium]